MQHQIKNLMHMQEDLIMGDVHGQHEWNPSMHISTMTVDTMLKAASTEELDKSAMQHQIRNLLHMHQDLIMGDAYVQHEWNSSMRVFTMTSDTMWRLLALKGCIYKSAMQHRIINLMHVHQDLTMADVHGQNERNPSKRVFTMAADIKSLQMDGRLYSSRLPCEKIHP